MNILHIPPAGADVDPLSPDSISSHIAQLAEAQQLSIRDGQAVTISELDMTLEQDIEGTFLHVHEQPTTESLELLRSTRLPFVQVFHMPVDEQARNSLIAGINGVPCIAFSSRQAKSMPEFNWVETVPHGVDTNKLYLFDPTMPREGLVFLGRIVPQKGVDWAIKAAIQADKTITVAGPIEDEAYWNNEIQPLVDGNRVRYRGVVTGKEKTTLLQQAEALLFPSQAHETFGMSAVEALACGTPVIGTDQGAIRDIVDGETTGYLVASTNDMVLAIDALHHLSPAHKRREVAEERFSVEAMAQAYMRAYEQILVSKMTPAA